MIVMDAMPMRWAGSAVIQSIEIIARLLEVLSSAWLTRAFHKSRLVAGNVINGPMPPDARRRVGIVAQQHETQGLLWRAGPLQRGRNVFAIASESAWNGRAIRKGGRNQSHDLPPVQLFSDDSEPLERRRHRSKRQHFLDTRDRKAMRLAHWRICDLAIRDIQSRAQMRVASQRLAPAFVRDRQNKRESGVIKRECRCPRDGAGDVGHAIMHDSIDDICRIGMFRRLRTLAAAALVYRHVDDNAPRLHDAEHFARYDLWSLRAGHENRP